MDSEAPQVEMVFLPFVGGGHQIPMIDIARLFASHGAKSTIIVTPTNAIQFQNSILRDQNSGHPISIHALQLPEGAVSPESDMTAAPSTDTTVLREPLKLFLTEHKPDCIVFDTFHRWAAELFDGLGIRKIVFNGSGCFPGCVSENIRKYEPHEKVGSDYESFLVPGLPDRIELTRSQIPIFVRDKSGRFAKMGKKDEDKSFGSVVNSFYELEPAYADYYRKEMGKKAWLVGPASLCNTDVADKAERGTQASIDEQSFMKWLDDKEPNSVLYIGFGSKPGFATGQFVEIAHALEASNCSFIWVVGKNLKDEENCLPGGFEERLKESKKGVIIRGWAPQLLILEHGAVGGFMTHCGWNSMLEGVCCGVPMITWPLSAEQFYNEKLVTDVLGIGVQVGSKQKHSKFHLQSQEKIPKKLVKEKQRVSTESSKSSFSSSSCSSSFSSLDHNKTAQIETSSFNQTIFPETPTRPMKQTIFPETSTQSTNQPNVSLRLRQPSLDLRDIVKDSIYREARALSVKTGGKEEAMGNTLIYIDSPRPLQAPKSVKPRATGLNDSFRILAKHREAPRNYKEQRDGFTLSSPRDAPRLSYDGSITQDAYMSTIKLKELPRLSLDSRQSSIRGSAPEPKSNFLLKDLQRRNGNSGNMLNHQQEPEISKRPSSIVAKLMGLESTPQSTSTSENSLEIMSSCQADKYDRFSEATDETKQNRISRSPRNSQDHISPRLKNADSVMRPTSGSRFPIEPAPWRQPEGSQSSELPAFMYGETTIKAPNCPSVYGEIEKRLSELEFKKSGKDLRALKQILEGMQKTKDALDTKRERAANFASQTSKNSSSYQSSNLASPRKLQNKDPISATIKGSPSPKSHKSPTVIMKPVNLIRRTSDPASSMIPTENMSVLRKPHGSADGRKFSMQSAKDPVSRNNHIQGPFSRLTCTTDKTISARTSKSASALKLPRHIIGENNTCSATVSPRLQQRKFGLQKQSPPPTVPSSDSSKTNRQHTKQPVGPNSPGRKVRPRSPNLQQCNEQLSEISSAIRDLSHEIDAISLISESSINFNSHMDTELTEVTSTNQSHKINTTLFQQYGQKQSSLEGFREDTLMAEPAIATMEQPSPISVLDATFYRDESPSPVKKISNAFKDYEALNPDEGEWNPEDLAQLPKCTKPSFSADIDNKKLENIQHFVQNLRQIYCTEEEPITNYIAPLHESTNSDHRYISEILLASGLLRDLDFGLMTIQLQASSHPIDYKVFLALEPKKAGAGLLNDTQHDIRLVKSEPNEKIQRKLTFDAVNEILVRKLLLEGPHQHWFLPNKLAGRKPGGQQLLEELCSEVDRLKNNNLNRSLDEEDDSLRSIILEDLRHRSMDWIDCHCEISGVVLDVERLIFKDLITEVLNSEVAALQGRPGGHCRKLFSKYGI